MPVCQKSTTFETLPYPTAKVHFETAPSNPGSSQLLFHWHADTTHVYSTKHRTDLNHAFENVRKGEIRQEDVVRTRHESAHLNRACRIRH